MKFAVTAMIMMTMVQPAFADRLGNAGGLDVEYGPPETEAPVSKPARVAMPKARTAPAPLPPMDIQSAAQAVPAKPTPAAKGDYTVDFQPVKATVIPGACQEPKAHPDAGKTPVLVTVDQNTQTIQVTVAGKVVLTDQVSTGGGFKNPKGRNAKGGPGPRCAKTHAIETVVSNISESDFAQTTCSALEKKNMSNVFDTYMSGSFTDDNDREVPMPKAIRFNGPEGEFFHVVPSTYKTLMGKPVSGGCVRLWEPTAAFLQKQIKRYGAIRVKINELQIPTPNHCDDAMVAQAKADMLNNKVSTLTQNTGSDGVVGGVKSTENVFSNFGSWLSKGGIFNPDNFRSQSATPPRPSQGVGTQGSARRS